MRPAWMNQDILIKLNHKKDTHRRWKQGQVSWGEYRDTVQKCRAGLRKAKAHLELNLVRHVRVHHQQNDN